MGSGGAVGVGTIASVGRRAVARALKREPPRGRVLTAEHPVGFDVLQEQIMAKVQHFSIATLAEQSPDFRRVLWTGKHAQLVIMTIPPDGEIGLETHEHTDQILTFVSGIGEAEVEGQRLAVAQGDLVVVPAGAKHNFRNTGANPLVLYTMYGPPNHADGAIHATKEDADAAEASGQDQPPAY